MRSCHYLLLASLLAWPATYSKAVDYHVGPSQVYGAIGDVPWESLDPGDAVYIHWRTSAYREKWVIGRSGTLQEPILVSGVAGPGGQLPVISGEGATTRRALDYTNESRGLLKIGSSNIPADSLPSHLIIENLDLRSARPPYTFTNDSGSQETYSKNAASIYVEKAAHLVIRNCIIQDSGNGIFIGAFDGASEDILIEGNRIFDNGIEGSYYEHNTYTAAIDITYQYNYMGALRDGAGGNNLKDRSAGLQVRYNWIEDGNRQLDLVDAEDSSVLVNHPAYHTTYVYGNVLVEGDGQGNSQMVHYGGDSGNEAIYRKGTLYFFNNTLVSTRSGNTTMLRLSSNGEFADVHNNIVQVTAEGNRLALVGSAGQLAIRHNWLKSGYRLSHDSFTGTFTDDGSSVVGEDPGFADLAGQDFHLQSGGAARDNGVALHPDLLAKTPLTRQYVRHTGSEPRPDDGILDIGAFEFRSTAAGDVDGSGSLELNDAILALQLAAGMSPGGTILRAADSDGDQKIGLAEAIYCLTGLSGR